MQSIPSPISFYRGAKAILFLYDITNTESIGEVHDEIQLMETIIGTHSNERDQIPMILVGTKSDLVRYNQNFQETKYQIDDLKIICEGLIGPIECSAKTSKNMDRIVHTLTTELLERDQAQNHRIHISNSSQGGRSGCQNC